MRKMHVYFSAAHESTEMQEWFLPTVWGLPCPVAGVSANVALPSCLCAPPPVSFLRIRSTIPLRIENPLPLPPNNAPPLKNLVEGVCYPISENPPPLAVVLMTTHSTNIKLFPTIIFAPF